MTHLTEATNKPIGLNLSRFSNQALEDFWEDEGIGFRPIRFEARNEQIFGRRALLIEGLALHFEDNPDAWQDFLRRLRDR